MLHLFNSSKELIASINPSVEDRQVTSCESTHLLEDRVVALEQDHCRLSSEVDHATAMKAEFDDVTVNERNEDSFVISGLPQVSGRLTTRE